MFLDITLGFRIIILVAFLVVVIYLFIANIRNKSYKNYLSRKRIDDFYIEIHITSSGKTLDILKKMDEDKIHSKITRIIQNEYRKVKYK